MFESVNVFVDLSNVHHFGDLKKKASFDQQLFCGIGALIYSNRFLGLYCFQQPIETLHSSNLDLCHWQI